MDLYTGLYCGSHNILNVYILKGQSYGFRHDVEWMWSAKGFHFDVDWFSSGLLYGLICTGLMELQCVEWMWSGGFLFCYELGRFRGLLYGLIWTGLTELGSTWRHWEAHQATPSLITTNNSEQASFAKSRL